MASEDPKDWDDAFANMAHVPGSDALPGIWTAQAATYRDSGVRIDVDIPYGDQPRERMDLVWPDGTPKGLAVFVHGGYWMRLDKSYWTDLAEGARSLGWAVCLPSYTLAPEARIRQMTRQVGAAITVAAGMVAGPIRLAGHSAGGHLVSRMICEDTPLGADLLSRIAHTVSISGLHDLRPLLRTAMNETLHLDPEEAAAESAALRRPAGTPGLTCWVGGGERPEFIRQARLLAMMWEGLDARVRAVVEPEHNHFTIIEALRSAESDLTKEFVGQ